MDKEKKLTDGERTEIAELGEFGLIHRLTKDLRTDRPSTLKGVGDDAAVIHSGDQVLLVSTDMLIEGTHFDLMYSPLKHLGYKSVVVNLSDILAMNAYPTQITLSLGLSNRFSVEAVEELFAGVQAACDHYQVDLVGGDTTSSAKGLVISVTAIGHSSPDRVTYRSGAKVGDILCVTGDLGAAYLGLQLLEREKQLFLDQPDIQPDLESQKYLVGRQLKPEARKDMVQIFEKAKVIPTSMIDVSDGLSSDLKHICFGIWSWGLCRRKWVPIHPEAQQMALKFKLDPITCALSGGEDYELLFTIDPKDLDKVRLMPDIYMMGEMVKAEDGINCTQRVAIFMTLRRRDGNISEGDHEILRLRDLERGECVFASGDPLTLFCHLPHFAPKVSI